MLEKIKKDSNMSNHLNIRPFSAFLMSKFIDQLQLNVRQLLLSYFVADNFRLEQLVLHQKNHFLERVIPILNVSDAKLSKLFETAIFNENNELILFLLNVSSERGISDFCKVQQFPIFIAASGNLDLLKWLKRRDGDFFEKSKHVMVEIAAERKQRDVIKFLLDMGMETVTMRALVNAASVGDLKTVKLLHSVGVGPARKCETKNAIDCAAANGHLAVVKWLHQNRTDKCSTDAMDKAAENGHFEILQFLHEHRTEGCTTNAMDYAAQKGHFEIVKWLHENRTEGCTTNAMDWAAVYGRFEIVKWLHEHQNKGCTSTAMDRAASGGYLPLLVWLHEHNNSCTHEAMDGAACNGKLETVIWLHENRTEGCTKNAMDWAAAMGQFEVVKWLHENRTEGCTYRAMDHAAARGRLDIVKFLHENRTEGCTYCAMDYAAANSHFNVMEWLYENRSEGCSILAFATGHGDAVKWLKCRYPKQWAEYMSEISGSNEDYYYETLSADFS